MSLISTTLYANVYIANILTGHQNTKQTVKMMYLKYNTIQYKKASSASPVHIYL